MYTGEYQLIGSEMRFFTRKLEAQLRFQRIPWRYRFKSEERKAELEARAVVTMSNLIGTLGLLPDLQVMGANNAASEGSREHRG